MAFDKTEQVILEQLKAGSYRLTHHFDWAFGTMVLTIPKTGSRPRVTIEAKSYYWDEESERYLPWGGGDEEVIDSVRLNTWRSSKTISLRNEEVLAWVKDVIINYWAMQSEERRIGISREDEIWAKRLRKVFG